LLAATGAEVGGFFKDRAFADNELLAALAALPQAVAVLALWVLLAGVGADANQLVCAINNTTLRVHRSICARYGSNILKCSDRDEPSST